MIDLAPTVARLAGAVPTRDVDGIDLMPYAADDRPQQDRALLLQAGSKGKIEQRAWKFRAVRTDRYTLTRWKVPKFRELYDRRRDPYQLSNVYDEPRYRDVRDRLSRYLLTTMQDCRGDACRTPVPRLPPLN